MKVKGLDYDLFVRMVAADVRTASFVHFFRKPDGSTYSWPTVKEWRTIYSEEKYREVGHKPLAG